jgi:hypothetical protein
MDVNIDLNDNVKKEEDNKPEKIKTYDLLILDKSSSMDCVKDATIAGFNEKISSLKTIQQQYPEQEYIVCFVTFNDKHETLVWNKNVNEVAELTDKYYVPCGMTALYDAIGHSVTKLLKDIKKELENKQTQIIITVFTDGEENSSTSFSGNKIHDLIGELESTKQWKFNYIGSNHDVIKVAKTMGISSNNTKSYTSDADGMTNIMKSANASYSKYAFARSVNKDSLTENTFSLNDDIEKEKIKDEKIKKDKEEKEKIEKGKWKG